MGPFFDLLYLKIPPKGIPNFIPIISLTKLINVDVIKNRTALYSPKELHYGKSKQ